MYILYMVGLGTRTAATQRSEWIYRRKLLGTRSAITSAHGRA